MNEAIIQAKIKKDGTAFLKTLDADLRPLVFTNGCFDILHAGHVNLLWRAKELGKTLVVGLNSSASVRRLKGPERPLNEWESRALILASLFFVDFVVGFDEDTPEALIRSIKPDVHAKGGDYIACELPEYSAVIENGGRVEILTLLGSFSTTSLIQRMRNG